MNPLLTSTYNCLKDRPAVNYPHRAAILINATLTNEHGVKYEARVLTNRTRTRWWLEIAADHWLKDYRTTSSKKRRDEWIAMLQMGDDGSRLAAGPGL